jgi:hypothetical protein
MLANSAEDRLFALGVVVDSHNSTARTRATEDGPRSMVPALVGFSAGSDEGWYALFLWD